MRNVQIVSEMNTYLHSAAGVMVNWLEDILPRTSENWWEECVLDKLSYNQREIAINNGYAELGQFDLAALLRIADKSWYAMRNIEYLPTKERECIRDMLRVRNNWAHASATLPGKDTILADLETLWQFFDQRTGDYTVMGNISRMMDAVKAPAWASEEHIQEEEKSVVDEEISANGNDISEKSLVYLIGEPEVRGIVMTVTNLGDTKKYDVFVNGSFNTYYTGQIALVQETASYNWGDINTFRSFMAAYQINNPSGNELYSLNSARIDFVPYQFRPALKMIHADEPRILIADSVGVGKTIEAGLIIKELQARYELNNVMIICPKPLVSERKWELEMQRFDEDFVPLNGDEIRRCISDTDRDGEWPLRFSKCIVPYSILDSRTYEGEEGKRGRVFGLKDLDPAPHFNLVIIDEAHHLRNGSMEKEKAYAYKCVKHICDNADAVVMLTATPLQTSDDDLFTLLNLLRPDVVIDKETFALMGRPNAYISKCSSAIRRADDTWQNDALEALRGVADTQWGENVIAANPVYSEAIRTLKKKVISREERVKLLSEVESLHSFNTMLNRTRRRDIQDFCIRRPYTLAVDFTDYQQAMHDELIRFEQNALRELHSNVRSIPFMMSTIRRQAASCIFGLAPYIRNLVNRRLAQLGEDMDQENEDFTFDVSEAKILTEMAQNLLKMADNLPDEDPKFDLMMSAVMEKQNQANNKVIIFSTFRNTLEYLKKKLQAEGLRVAQVDGSVKDVVRQDLRARFEMPKEDDEALDILLFTEVGSEGLDYQFCDMMINYDLPWNPMAIEQRIGRIDRRGQKSESVSIYNMITNGTVDADIYYRCLMRIGIFENSIGECDEILGEIAARLDEIAIDSALTEDERCRKLEQIADNEVRRMQELDKLEEEEKEFFGFDLSEYMTSQEIHNAENPWLSQNNISLMIKEYLDSRLGEGNYILGEGDLKTIRLSVDAREALRSDLQKLPGGRNAVKQKWEAFLKGIQPMHTITFDAETAEKHRDAFFITAMHPLSKQAAGYFSTNEKAYIHLQYASDDLPGGRYHFSVYAWSFAGLNPHFKLVTVCDNDTVSAELPEILKEAQSKIPGIKIDATDWDVLERKHVDLWKKARASEISSAEAKSAFRMESIKNNYMNKKRSLEQRIKDSNSDSIRRMYMSELETAEERYEFKSGEIMKQVDQTDIHTTLIANGILEVLN